jgi:hypothetical protein
MLIKIGEKTSNNKNEKCHIHLTSTKFVSIKIERKKKWIPQILMQVLVPPRARQHLR